jgi:predicted transcriptional regulator
VAKSLPELYDEAKPLTSKIFANGLRSRIIICLDDNARFFDEIVDFVEADKRAVRSNLKALEEAKVVQCIDEIYSLTRELGKPSAKFLRESRKEDNF